MADVEMKEAATEPAAKGKGVSKSEGANGGKKRFEVKRVQSQGPSVTTSCHLFWALTWLALLVERGCFVGMGYCR